MLARHFFNFRYGLMGGGVRFGENLEDTVRREIGEELRCKVGKAKHLFFIDSWFQRHEVFSVTLMGKPKPNWEIRELKRVSLGELRKLKLNPSTRKIFERLLKEKDF